MRGFASLSYEETQNQLTAVLTVIVIFAYIECSLGNYKGLECHVRALSVFMNTLHQKSGDPFVKALLTAWMQPRLVAWWARAYFSSMEAQLQLPSIPLPGILRSSFELFEERRVQVLSIMCESHRLNVIATLKHWAPADMLGSMSSACTGYDTIATCYTLLAAEARRLDEWLLNLPPSEQPFSEDTTGRCISMSSETALYFLSHDSALNYAYYIVARIMQCTGFLRCLSTRDPKVLGHECSKTEPWVRQLLRIAQGSDLRKSITQNVYTIGISGLLLAAFFRCQDLSLGSNIENWLQALDELEPTEEGNMPIFQALSVVRAINRQRTMGRDIFAVSKLVDGPDGAKFSCYCGQIIDSLLVYGKIRSTGEFFVDCISVEGQHTESRGEGIGRVSLLQSLGGG
jgi:hypothetical protein